MLLSNFFLNILQTELIVKGSDQNATKEYQIFDTMDKVYTAIYIIELLVNLYGHWY